jgi:mRNA deadenylase 3'-5' endonuclease subunit Ccr4
MTPATIAIRTWNVLADAYCVPSRYPNTPLTMLAPGARDELIIGTILAGSADVVCLQEVQEGLARGLASALGDTFDVRWLQKRGRPDGCLTIVRWPWVVYSDHALYYNNADNATAATSGHIAQVFGLRNGADTIALANTHLRWGDGTPGMGQIGLRQANELINYLDTNFDSQPVVVLGDINDRPGGPIRQLLSEAGFVEHQGDAPTAVVDAVPTGLDVVCARCATKRSSSRHPYPTAPLPRTRYPSDHVCVDVNLELLPPT